METEQYSRSERPNEEQEGGESSFGITSRTKNVLEVNTITNDKSVLGRPLLLRGIYGTLVKEELWEKINTEILSKQIKLNYFQS